MTIYGSWLKLVLWQKTNTMGFLCKVHNNAIYDNIICQYCCTQVGTFSYELLQNIKELKIYQDIFVMDAKPTSHEMRIDRSFSLSSLQTSACLPESCYCSFCRNTEYYLIKFSEYDNYFKVHKCVALWSVWSSERWSHGWPQSHPFCQFCELAQEKYQFWQIKNVLRLSW